MNGQLYIVKTRGRLKECGGIEKCAYIISSSNKDEVEAKLAYFVDFSLYSEFSLKTIERIKPNFHILSRSLLSAAEYVASKQEEQIVAEESKRESPTLQEANKYMYAFGCVGYIHATSESNAIKRVSNFLARKALGSNAAMPFAENGHFIIEQLGESDNTKTVRLDKFENFSSGSVKMVAGGAASPR